MSAHWFRRIHGYLTITWGILIIPSILWWRDSVPYLVMVSVWANFATHWSSWQGARAEEAVEREE